MVESGQDFDLSLHLLLPVQIMQFELVVLLDGDNLLGGFVQSLIHNCESSAANLLAERVHIDIRTI